MFPKVELLEYAEELQREVCARCLGRLSVKVFDCEHCTRPEEFLFNLLREAAEEAGTPAERLEWLHRRLHHPATKQGAVAEDQRT